MGTAMVRYLHKKGQVGGPEGIRFWAWNKVSVRVQAMTL